jgi:hypothetical protein
VAQVCPWTQSAALQMTRCSTQIPRVRTSKASTAPSLVMWSATFLLDGQVDGLILNDLVRHTVLLLLGAYDKTGLRTSKASTAPSLVMWSVTFSSMVRLMGWFCTGAAGGSAPPPRAA